MSLRTRRPSVVAHPSISVPMPPADDLPETLSPHVVGRIMAIVVAASTVFVLPLAPMLASAHNVTALRINTIAALDLAVLGWFVPWDRHRRAMTWLAVIVLGHTAMSIYVAERVEVFVPFLLFIFVFVGLALPRWTSISLFPLAAATYVVPVLVRGLPMSEALRAALYVPTSVVAGEAISWLAHRLRSTEAGLVRLDRLKNEFIAMVAHDVRTPMTVISGFTETLRNETLTAEERRTFLDTILRNTKRCTEFVENLLQFARIEVGEFHQSARPFDLADVARRLTGELEAVHGLDKVTVRADADLPPAFGDEARHWQVLANLLSNAVKFSAPGEPILVEITRSNDAIQVAVRDRGPGIAPDEVSKLFKKFASMRSSGPNRAVGTGLGLYICRKIVEAGGGRMWVETRPGRGATFFYTVPTANGDVPEPAADDAARGIRRTERH